MHARVLRVLLLWLIVPAPPPAAVAQTAATISGTVAHVNRSVLPGVTVTARNVDTALVRTTVTGDDGRYRLEGFNVLNRANFGIPELRAFAGTQTGEAPLATCGRISNTVTSARQLQLGVRLAF